MLLQCKNVSKIIRDKVVLKDISFEVDSNTINFIIGPNAAGKTTLGKILVGEDNNYTGEVLNTIKCAQQFIPQSIEINRYLPLSVNEYLDLFIKSDIKSFSSFINLEAIRDKQLSELSAGQLQKLFLISALSSSSKLIVFDEPTASLDPDSCHKFFLLLRQYVDVTFIIISHDLHMVSAFADQVICINKHVCCVKSIGFKSEDFIRYYHNHDHQHD